MIKAQEFRIGNLYYPTDASGGFAVVEGIDICNWSDRGARYGKPIPLTEDWLVRAGCIKQRISSTKKNYWNKELDFSVDVEFDFAHEELFFYYLVHNQGRRKLIIYVHQLMNLFYALTGTELTFKMNEK